MRSLGQEIAGFSKANLRKQCTRVTTVTGKRTIETWEDSLLQVEEDTEREPGCGYVQDFRLDLQLGVIKPWLLLGSQDAAQDLETMKKYKITHVLNVAYGVANTFPDDFIYKSIEILDLPQTDIRLYFLECFHFLEETKKQGGVVLVHCNAGVSRSAAIVIGYLMHTEGLNFARAFSTVKNARPAICPNAGFMEQLHNYQQHCKKKERECAHQNYTETEPPENTD